MFWRKYVRKLRPHSNTSWTYLHRRRRRNTKTCAQRTHGTMSLSYFHLITKPKLESTNWTNISWTFQFTVKHQTVISKDKEKIWFNMRQNSRIPRENYCSLCFSNWIQIFLIANYIISITTFQWKAYFKRY